MVEPLVAAFGERGDVVDERVEWRGGRLADVFQGRQY
jgi:hypothetical protein